jgi:hypothetical protein
MPGYHRGRPPRNEGEYYPADPPTVEEIVAVNAKCRDGSDGHRASRADRAADLAHCGDEC